MAYILMNEGYSIEMDFWIHLYPPHITPTQKRDKGATKCVSIINEAINARAKSLLEKFPGK